MQNNSEGLLGAIKQIRKKSIETERSTISTEGIVDKVNESSQDFDHRNDSVSEERSSLNKTETVLKPSLKRMLIRGLGGSDSTDFVDKYENSNTNDLDDQKESQINSQDKEGGRIVTQDQNLHQEQEDEHEQSFDEQLDDFERRLSLIEPEYRNSKSSLSGKNQKRFKNASEQTGYSDSKAIRIGTKLDALAIPDVSAELLLGKMKETIVQRLSNTSIENICTPDLAIAGPILEILNYASHKPLVVRLCASLMATTMNTATSRFAHAGFVDVIKNISGDEARIIEFLSQARVVPVIDIKKVILDKQSEILLNTLISTVAVDAKCEHSDLGEFYLANLERIGLVDIHRDVYLTDENIYDRILNAPPVKDKLLTLNKLGNNFSGEVVKYYAKLSVYGLQFCVVCVAGE